MLVWSLWTRLQISPNLRLVTRSLALKYCTVCYFGIKESLLHHRDTPQVIYVLSYKFLFGRLEFLGTISKVLWIQIHAHVNTQIFNITPFFTPMYDWSSKDPFQGWVLSGQCYMSHCLDPVLNGPMYQGR